MKILDIADTLEILATSLNKCCMYISFDQNDDTREVVKAAPYLDGEMQIMIDGCAYIVCDSTEEIEALYGQTVGDDGPTKENPYDGPARVYTLTCDADGRLLTENT